MIDDAQQGGLNELSLNNRGLNPEQRLAGQGDAALRDGINIACKAKILKIFKKVGLKDVQALQIGNILRRKVEVLNILNGLIQTGNDGKAAENGFSR